MTELEEARQEIARLQTIIESLTARVAGQSDILSRFAEADPQAWQGYYWMFGQTDWRKTCTGSSPQLVWKLLERRAHEEDLASVLCLAVLPREVQLSLDTLKTEEDSL